MTEPVPHACLFAALLLLCGAAEKLAVLEG